MKRIRLAIIIVSIIACLTASAQEEGKKKDLPFDIGADLMSRFVWRGQCLSKAPNSALAGICAQIRRESRDLGLIQLYRGLC